MPLNRIVYVSKSMLVQVPQQWGPRELTVLQPMQMGRYTGLSCTNYIIEQWSWEYDPVNDQDIDLDSQ